MKPTIALLFEILYIILSLDGVVLMESYKYEKQNFFGLGRRLFPNPRIMANFMNKREAYPDPLPTSSVSSVALSSRSLYQGVRSPNDTRVFRRRFEYAGNDVGQKVLCEGLFECAITFLAIESTEAIPVLLKGGVGHTYFTAIIKAKPGRNLKGQVRAYCKEPEKNKT